MGTASVNLMIRSRITITPATAPASRQLQRQAQRRSDLAHETAARVKAEAQHAANRLAAENDALWGHLEEVEAALCTGATSTHAG